MGSVAVGIINADVYYTHLNKAGAVSGLGHVSQNHDLNTLVIASAANAVYATNAVSLTSDNFVRFKNGGKRLPSSLPGKQVGKKAAKIRSRPDRSHGLVQQGDVGSYKTGPNSLKYGAAVPNLERDHLNSFASVKYRTDVLNQGAFANMGYSDYQIKARGVVVAIPHQVHSGGWTYGSKQHLSVPGTGLTRKTYAATYPSEALFKEIDESLAIFNQNNTLTYEIVGSYRYLYKLNVSSNFVDPTDELDGLIEAYLAVAT